MISLREELRDGLTLAASIAAGDPRLGQRARDAAADVMLEADLIAAMQAAVSLIIELEEAEEAAANAAACARGALRDALDATTGSIRTPLFTATISNPRPSVLITDETLIPPEYIETVTRPDKGKIASAMKHGERVPGAELRNGAPVLRIVSTVKRESSA